MIRLMIGRDLKSIYTAARRAAGRAGPRDRRRAHRGLPRPVRRSRGPPRRDPRSRRADRRRPHRARPRRSSASTAARRRDPPRRRARSRSPRRATPSPAASTSSPRTARPAAWCSTCRSPATSRCPSSPALAARGLVDAPAETALAEAERRRLGIRSPGVDHARSARSRAATSRRWCWRNGWRCGRVPSSSTSRPAASTSAPSARSTTSCAALADAGVAILMISSDMEEVIGVSDRIAVMHEGRISGTLARDGVFRAQRAAACRRPPRLRRGSDAEEGPRPARPDPRGRRRRRADQPALHLADQPRQHREPRRPLRPLRHRPGLRDHHRRHRALGRLGDRAARRALRRSDRELRRALAAGARC